MAESMINIVEPGFEFIDETDVPKKIERIARVCYKSEDKITDDSYKKMLGNLLRNGHLAMLEHGSLILEPDRQAYEALETSVRLLSERHGFRPFLRLTRDRHGTHCLASGNIRAWLEYSEAVLSYMPADGDMIGNTALFDAICTEEDGTPRWSPLFDSLRDKIGRATEEFPFRFAQIGSVREADPESLSGKEIPVHLDASVRFICDRGISHEIVRHRPASFAQESTRYCNYGKNGKINVINPSGLGLTKPQEDAWKLAMEQAGAAYMRMIELGCSPQQARAVLPTSVKTEIVMTTNLQEWKHFLELRACGTTGKPHPQMLQIAVPLLKEFQIRWPEQFAGLHPMDI